MSAIPPVLLPSCSFSSPLRSRRRGSALVVTVGILTLMAAIILAYVTVALDSAAWTQQRSDEQRLEFAAESAIALAVEEIWGDFDRIQQNQRTSPWNYRVYMDGLGILDQSNAVDPAPTLLTQRLDLPDGNGIDEFDGIQVDSVSVLREDVADRIRMTFAADVHLRVGEDREENRGTLRRQINQVWTVERGEWDGLDFALLANNINCIMCHADIDSAQRRYNFDPQRYGTFQRIKVGSIESVEMRHSVDSSIAGSLYLGGRGYDSSGNTITNWPTRDLKSRVFNSEGVLQEDPWGNTIASDMTPADTETPQPFENLYLGYGEEPNSLVDGFMPETFPAVFPDDGGIDPATGQPVPENASNRILDDSEFYASVGDSLGSLSGGSIHVSSSDNVISTSASLSDFGRGNASSLASVTEGNVRLTGTAENPIVLNGDIAIQGDLILEGYVVGEGTLRVSGNVYVPSDLQYADGADADGNRTYGVGESGGSNAMAIASGGNILVGNIFHPRWGSGDVTGDSSGSFSFIMDELAIFNRQEWTKTQPLLPGESDDATDPTTYSVENPLYEGPDYLPRYYSFNDSGVVPIFNRGIYFDESSASWIGAELPGSWSARNLTQANLSDPTDAVLYNADGSTRAVVSQLTATDGWISDEMLEELMESSLSTRPDSDAPLVIDAVLYSNDSIFGIIPTSRRARGLNGRMVVNGAIVAADIGLLSPNSIEINFDDRGRRLLNITSDTQLTIRRQLARVSAN